MDLTARYAVAYKLLENAVEYEMSLMAKADHITDLNARRALLAEYGDAAALRFARTRELSEIREEMLQQKRPSFINRIFRKK